MNIQRQAIWTEWQRQKHLRQLAEHARQLAQHRHQQTLCRELTAYLQGYDQTEIDDQAMALWLTRHRRAFAGQIDRVQRQQQQETQAQADQLAKAAERLGQAQSRIEHWEQRLQQHALQQQRDEQLREQRQVQEWLSQRRPVDGRH